MRPAPALTLTLAVSAVLGLPPLQQQEEAIDYYKKWLEQDVVYLVTPEERDVFGNLRTDEERERFIEQFWRRRDPDPATAVNEFKEEHYRRIAYSNERFASGIPGWKTDRGMIYIKFGPPDHVEANPSGGNYIRKSWEGGGTTSTFAFERWEYRNVEGVGQDVEIEFVDDTFSGEYRLTLDPDDKDAFLHVPNAGLTDAEALGLVAQKVDRIVKKTSPMPENNPSILGPQRMKDQPFERLGLLYNLSRAPEIDLSDLKRQVRATVHFDSIPFEIRNDVFVGPDSSGRVLLTLYVKSSDLSARRENGLRITEAQVYGTFKSLTGRLVREIEESLISRVPAEREPHSGDVLAFQKELFLPAGRYKLDFFLKDVASERLAVSESLVLVEEAKARQLTLSPVLLARQGETAPAGDGTATTRFKVWPLTSDRVSFEHKRLSVYFEAYNFARDGRSRKPMLEIECDVLSSGGATPARQNFRSADFAGDRVAVMIVFSLEDLARGRYSLRIKVRDHVSGRQLVRTVPFQFG